MSPLRATLLAACAAVVGAPAFAQGRVVINEFQYDDSSTDDREFVELFNAGPGAVDISGWRLEAYDENTPNAAYTVPAGTILQANDYWVMGSGVVANVDQIVGATDLWQNDMETLELKDASGNLVDALAYEVNKQLFTLSAALRAQVAEGLWGNFSSIDGKETSWSRLRDGYDTNDNGRDFRTMPLTPGTSNDVASILAYVDNYDAYTPPFDAPNWGGTFVKPFIIDPTQIGNSNPNSIPYSPQGGNALLCWDPAGGGDAGMLVTDVIDNVVFEAYVYFEATPTPAGEYETWSIGVQGAAETYYNSPDLGGVTTGFTANGCTGVSLTYRRDDFGGKLYLIDHNNGGQGATAVTGWTVLGSMVVTQGLNDGWQRVRLHAGHGMAEAHFGGTYGMLDGQRMYGRIADGQLGGIYLGYREFLVSNGSARPPTLDFVIVRPGNADVTFNGVATPNSVDTPVIQASSMPNLGDVNFGIEMSGLVPNSSVALVIGFSEWAPPINLELIGAQPGSRLYVNGSITQTLPTNANGEASLPLAVPNNVALLGGSIYSQGVQIDVNIPATVPICQTESMRTRIGN